MLFVDDRVGSKDLLGPLNKFGVQAELMRLEFGDFAFIGRGLAGKPVHIGIELKETRDLISSLQSGRFAGHQLQGLLSTYDHSWLVTEGIWRAADSGILEVMAGGWKTVKLGSRPVMARDLEKWLLTIQYRGAVSVHHCSTRRDTIRWLSVIYHWWTDKDLDEHKSHQMFHTPYMDRNLLLNPSLCQRVSKELPGIGYQKSQAVDAHFGSSVRRMVLAPASEWKKIDGIGPTIAAKVVEALK